ncbi:MAG: phosphatase PAP2 family protein [Deltaproteobacteria bacterium HGW-Deltaproteobacteria-12]|jgi:membrane-associated phospholipid phosphatase|nr:MAG: phosphatase PAP2 family protein [Deltaproteobacteria bacterium HGW-Deltaproteobacteria-12]
MKKQWIAACIFFFCFIFSVISYYYWDIPLAYYCRSLSRSVLDIAEIITITGESKWYYIILVPSFVVVHFILKHKIWSMRVLFLFVALSASGLINMLIKWIAGRHRPINMFNNGEFGFEYFRLIYESTSFPSGHTVTSFALAAAISILFPRWSIPAYAAAAAIGMSRIMITSHYLSDVFAGAGIGIICALGVQYYFDRFHLQLGRK